MADVLSRLQSVLAGFTARPPEALTPDLRIVDDLELDSLSKLEAALAIEQTFGVQLDDDDAESMQTVGDAVRVIGRRLAGAG